MVAPVIPTILICGTWASAKLSPSGLCCCSCSGLGFIRNRLDESCTPAYNMCWNRRNRRPSRMPSFTDMTSFRIAAFVLELVLLPGALAIFFVALGDSRAKQARTVALFTSCLAIAAALLCLGQQATLFDGAYRVDLFSQVLKLVFACGLALILLL